MLNPRIGFICALIAGTVNVLLVVSVWLYQGKLAGVNLFVGMLCFYLAFVFKRRLKAKKAS